MDFLAYLIHLITAHPFAYMAIAVLLPILMANISSGPKTRFQKNLYVALFLGIPINFFFGHYINSKIVYWAGEPGSAQVVGSYQTSTRYNNHDVLSYHVLIKTQEGKTIETSFQDDDFNVYPSRNSVSYPQEGDRFNVRYLEHFPESFIIITNDNSPWAASLECRGWKRKLDEARNKYDFNKSDKQYKAAYIQAIKDYVARRCYTDSTDLKEYYGDIEAAEQGR